MYKRLPDYNISILPFISTMLPICELSAAFNQLYEVVYVVDVIRFALIRPTCLTSR